MPDKGKWVRVLSERVSSSYRVGDALCTMHYLVTLPCCIANEAHSGEKSNKCNQCDYAFSEDTFGKTQWGKIKGAVTAS